MMPVERVDAFSASKARWETRSRRFPRSRRDPRAVTICVGLACRRDRAFSRSFLNDYLIAASAHDQGFVLVTRNLTDFALIGRVERGLRYVPPWPES